MKAQKKGRLLQSGAEVHCNLFIEPLLAHLW